MQLLSTHGEIKFLISWSSTQYCLPSIHKHASTHTYFDVRCHHEGSVFVISFIAMWFCIQTDSLSQMFDSIWITRASIQRIANIWSGDHRLSRQYWLQSCLACTTNIFRWLPELCSLFLFLNRMSFCYRPTTNVLLAHWWSTASNAGLFIYRENAFHRKFNALTIECNAPCLAFLLPTNFMLDELLFIFVYIDLRVIIWMWNTWNVLGLQFVWIWQIQLIYAKLINDSMLPRNGFSSSVTAPEMERMQYIMTIYFCFVEKQVQ